MGAITIEESLDMDPETQRKLDDIVSCINDLKLDMGIVKSQQANMGNAIAEIKDCYVTLLEFKPVQKVVFTIVGCAGLAVIGAMVKLVIIK